MFYHLVITVSPEAEKEKIEEKEEEKPEQIDETIGRKSIVKDDMDALKVRPSYSLVIVISI